MGLKVKLVQGDAPAEQGPSAAQTVAQKFISNKNLVAVIGGSTSGSVAATSKAFNQAGLVQISSSATRTTLTKGDNQEATKSFFRVIPADDYQGPTDAKYMIGVLKVKNVAIIDFQEPYSQGLAGEVEKALKAAGVTTSHQSIPNTVTDFSSYVTKVPSDADIVFFPSQKPGDAQSFAQQLVEQGKKAKVFGGDGTNGPGAFKATGAYVSNFAPQIDTIASDKALIAAWKKANPGKSLGSFGPPTYGAVQVALMAIKAACDKGKGSLAKRGAVIQNVKKVTIPNGKWILGGAFAWSKVNSNDPNTSRFYIMQIQSNGTYKLVN
jgi:branched-chain amino acid transport system substrate-binding protein